MKPLGRTSGLLQRSAFTLIELLVVIAIIAILAVVVVLTLNPAQLLAQSRDANRVSDMATLGNAVNLYATDQAGASTYTLGTASTSYISLPSAASNCGTLGLPSSSFSYACATSANYRLASSSGWLPINFQAISAGAPFGALPVDPVNATSSNLYYTYQTNGSLYQFTAFMESAKYAKNMQTVGGDDPALYEVGSGAAVLPNLGRGLVGYWPLNEGGSGPAIDWSGAGNPGVWSGTQAGTSAYYSSGKISQWAGYFNGTDDKIIMGSTSTFGTVVSSGNPLTILAWIDPANCSASNANSVFDKFGADGIRLFLSVTCQLTLQTRNPGALTTNSGAVVSTNTWSQVGVTVTPSGAVTLYLNGVATAAGNAATSWTAAASPPYIGFAPNNTNYFTGLIGDVRLYDRVLSTAEIQEIYSAEK